MKIYQDLDYGMHERAALAEGFKTIEPFNDQYNNTEKEDPKLYPACYYELLEPINWRQAGNQWQHATVRAKLHIVVFTLKTAKESIHSKAQTMFETFNQKHMLLAPDDEQLTTEWVRIASTLPKRYKNLKVITIDFEFEAFDRSGMVNLDAVTVPFVLNTGQQGD